MAISTGSSDMNGAASDSPAQPPTGPEGRPPAAPPIAPGFGTFGMTIFLFALGVLFTASIVAYLYIRARAEVWPPPNAPRLPAGLWVSTGVIILCSVSIQRALSSVRRDRPGLLIGGLLITLLLGLVFLLTQAMNWLWLISLNVVISPLVRESLLAPAAAAPTTAHIASLYLFTFYVLTALHALHVLGGMVLLAVVTARAFAGRYSSAYYPGVKYAAMYWHFLDCVWIVMFVLLFLL